MHMCGERGGGELGNNGCRVYMYKVMYVSD